MGFRSPLTCVLLVAAGVASGQQRPRIELLRTPNGGIQPQAAVDAKGVLHLIYFKGNPGAGNLFYVHREPGSSHFSNPLRVNRQPGSAVAVGTIRGAQMALGRRGRVHVAWNGSVAASKGKHPGAPMLYTRLNDAGAAFEPERDVITRTGGLDGGGSVAADARGNVYVVWHGFLPGNQDGEAGRAVFVAHSSDDGRTFLPEVKANPEPTGACGCCGLRAFADRAGTLYILYRAAFENIERGEQLLVSRDFGNTFALAPLDQWRLSTCPMSSASLAAGPATVLAAWERAGQVYFTNIRPGTARFSTPASPPGTGARKHPVAVADAVGDVLLVWTEGTGWERGGALGWRLFDRDGRPTVCGGRVEGVPVWGLATAAARRDGGFTIIF